jgi:RNA polymerase sigma factor FliA
MYTATGTRDRQKWIQQYAPLVKRIAHHIMAKLPASVEVDDIIQAGMMGLMDAVGRYEETQGAQFETYAAQRIRGAMLDELRSCDWLPRGIRKNMRTIEKAMHSLEQTLGRHPTEPEIAAQLEMPLPAYQQMLQEARGHQLVYYEDYSEGDEEHFLDRHAGHSHPSPLEALVEEGMRERLVEAIGELPDREKMMMGLYYEQDLNLREIGEIMGVSESRVCQIHTQAIARLRSTLREEN